MRDQMRELRGSLEELRREVRSLPVEPLDEERMPRGRAR